LHSGVIKTDYLFKSHSGNFNVQPGWFFGSVTMEQKALKQTTL